jgi:DNA anti-recombination protein RmuC
MIIYYALFLFLGLIIGFLSALFIIPNTSFGKKIFDSFFKGIEQKALEALKKTEEIKDQNINQAVEKQKNFAEGAYNAIVSEESQQIKQLLSDAKDALSEAKTTWSTGNSASISQVEKLSKQFIRWQEALTNPSKQGFESEVALESLLDSLGFVKDLTYKTQVKKIDEEGSIKIPDVFVRTKGDKWFVIDSKAPMKAFSEIVEADTENIRKEAVKKLCSNFENHIKTLGKKKYEELDNKLAPFTVMFVPNPALYLTVINEAEKNIVDISQENRVLIATPTMLVPILQIFNEGLLEEDFESKKDNFRSLVKRFIEAVGFLDKHFHEAEKNVSKASESLNSFRNSWNHHLPKRSRDLIDQQNLEVEEISRLPNLLDQNEEIEGEVKELD